MEPLTSGRRLQMMDSLGRTLAAATRDGTAPNLRETDQLPPEFVCRPSPGRSTRRDGRPKLMYGPRFKGGNSIALRLDARERRLLDPRYATLSGASVLNAVSGYKGRPLRTANSVTGLPPVPVELASHRLCAVQPVHEADGYAFRPGGSFGAVKAGEPLCSETGRLLRHTYERAGTYRGYHVTDLDLPALPERVGPGMRRSSLEKQDTAFARECELRGEPVRQPTRDERVAMIVVAGVGRRLAEQGQRATIVESSADADGVRFSVQGGQPRLEISPPSHFVDVHDQATAVMQACAHANLYFALKERVATAHGAGESDPVAAAGVAAYEAPLYTRLDSSDMIRPELVATYAAVNLTTEVGGTYVPAPSTRNEVLRECWAQLLEEPGGMALLSRDIADAETFSHRRSNNGPSLQIERASEPSDHEQNSPPAALKQVRLPRRDDDFYPAPPAILVRRPGAGDRPGTPGEPPADPGWKFPGASPVPAPGERLPRPAPVLPGHGSEKDGPQKGGPGPASKPLKVGGDRDVPVPPSRGGEISPMPSAVRQPVAPERSQQSPSPGGPTR